MPLPVLHFIRTLRTQTSERFLLTADDAEQAALDLHFLPDNSVDGTLILLDNARLRDDDVPALLQLIDQVLLPHVSLETGNLHFTVLRAKVLGDFSPTKA